MSSHVERPLPGGPLAIDLLNTAWGVGEERVDWLDFDGSVEEFATGHGHSVSPREVPKTRAALVDARGLVRRMLEATSTAEAMSNELIDEVNAFLGKALVELRQPAGLPTIGFSGSQPEQSLAIEALIDAVELANGSPGRVRACEHVDCVLWFVDTSKGGRRRWCSMERCGNRAKAQRHYERSRTTRRPPASTT